ncbi:RNA polymerase ii transcription factor b subunit 5 [Seiridium cupressi]
MPKARRVKGSKGVLIECDPSIKSIIMNIDSEYNEYILHDLDDTHLVIQENKVQDLKRRLDDVGFQITMLKPPPLTTRSA